ncbi:MAG: alkaline phosphatase [Pseudomonadota bacterium]
MRKFVAIGALMFSSNLVAAQELPQASSPWYQQAQEALEARLANEPNTSRALNVILFVADGNGVGTNYASRLFAGQSAGGLGDEYLQPFETFPNVALIKTYSTNGQTPDSAPTASAMNSGIKTKNDLINVTEDAVVGDCAAGLENGVRTFAEIVAGEGKSVGVVSTARITHATPAAVYARTADRDWEDSSEIPADCAQADIATQLIEQMKSGVIDIALGGGRRHFLPDDMTDVEGEPGRRNDGRNLISEAEQMGAQVVFGSDDFAALSAPGNAPILGLFEPSHMLYEADRRGEPSLAEMTEAAIASLSANDQGFYLQVEAGRVDHANHAGNLYRTVTDGKAFADAVAKAMEMTSVEDTLIIVTADHEHALAFNGYCGRGSSVVGLCQEIDDAGIEALDEPALGEDGKPYTVAGFLNGPGSVLKEQADGQWSGSRPELTEAEATAPDYLQQAVVPRSSETHSGEDVALFARGPWAHLFGGVMEQNEIFAVMNHAVRAQ